MVYLFSGSEPQTIYQCKEFLAFYMKFDFSNTWDKVAFVLICHTLFGIGTKFSHCDKYMY